MITADVTRALADLGSRSKNYELYEDYYNGDQRLLFATDKFKSIFGVTFGKFADNLCPAVVDSLTDRLQLTGFGLDEDVPQAEADKIQEAIDETWENNRMDKVVGEIHQEVVLTGDAYLIVWPSKKDPSKPVIYPNKASLMTVAYDEECPGELLWAAKCWVMVDKRVRLTMYYPDRIEKYVTAAPVQGAATLKPESFVSWTEGGPDVVPHQYGRVPVFHFANNARTGQMGRSELRAVIPLQDALNKAITDMLVAMEFVALPQRWIAGMEIDVDPVTGLLKFPFQAGVDRIWTSDDSSTKFGEFPGANLASFIAVQDGFRTEIARVSRTPQHYFMLDSTNFPSGESLKTAESPFTAKAKDRMVTLGNTWEDVMAFALQVASVTVDAVALNAEWKDPAPRSEKEYAEYLTIAQQLTPPMLRKLDFSEDEIEEIMGGAKTVGGAILDAFNNGIGAGIRSTQQVTSSKGMVPMDLKVPGQLKPENPAPGPQVPPTPIMPGGGK